MKLLGSFLGLMIAFSTFSKSVDVRLFSTASLSESWVSTHGATYFLLALTADGKIIDTVADFADYSASRSLHVGLQNQKVVAKHGGKSYGAFHQLMLVPSHLKSHFIIKGKGAERIYGGAVIFRNMSGQLFIINRTELEEYVAGVVESEGGRHAKYEYFKAQAVLARTWVLKNWDKHKSEGYNVRDDVSSQAYYSKAYLQHSDEILRAVRETKDTILVDKRGEPIMGVFHSNSGGQTVNSEDAWSGTIDYLRSVPDSFSLQMDKAYWTKELNKQDFLNYFASKTGQSASNAAFRKAVFSFEQPTRLGYFEYNGKRLKLRYVREKFKLRSTFFSVEEKGDKVILHGRGFGHGVGMSQEGAMRMSELGLDYRQILRHYFKDVRFGVISTDYF